MSLRSNLPMRRLAVNVIASVALATGLLVELAAQGSSADTLVFRQSILEAEDSRAVDPAGLAMLLAGIESPSAEIQQIAVRALGRLERSDLSDRIRPLVEADLPAVRVEAVNALGQSLQLDGDLSVHVTVLLARLNGETNAEVRGVVAETLGRLPYQDVQMVRRVELALARLTDAAEPSVRLGAVDGLETVARLQRDRAPLAVETIVRLRAAGGTSGSNDTDARMRRLALAALSVTGAADAATISVALDDSDSQVRRLAALALHTPGDLAGREALIARALADESPMVRLDALGAYGQHGRAMGCDPLVDAVEDVNPHIALRALDLLSEGCPADVATAILVARIAGQLDDDGDWHRAAHALVTLASLDPTRAGVLLPRFIKHPVWQVRMYAARAAARVGDAGAVPLNTLAGDSNANVRGAALRGVMDLEGHAADHLLLKALGSDDYGLLRTVAGLLKGSPHRLVPTILLATLARLTETGRDTSRDPRVAILTRLRELGARRNAGVLRSYLEDSDPRVAAAAAEVLSDWTGRPVAARTTRLRTGVSPLLEDVIRLTGARVRMVNGAEFELKLYPEEAPATVERFSRLARNGYYAGLTFHRVVPNFVIQGGSPGANEFMGDGPYMRDELGLRPHVRGAVGISTRGRDTGDAQIFVNLVDNPRLDHNYTVFAQVTNGMDVVDTVLEGDMIEKVEIFEQ